MRSDALPRPTRLEIAVRFIFAFASGALSLFLSLFASGPDYRTLLGWSLGLAIVFAILIRPLLQDPAFPIRTAAWVLATPVALSFLFAGLFVVAILLDRSL